MKNSNKLLIVGSFLGEERGVYGGVARSCDMLMQSSFKDRFEIVTIDSTQISNPPPGLFIRVLLAIKRLWRFVLSVRTNRPEAVLLFSSIGVSFIEKSVMAWIGKWFGSKTYLFPRGGKLIEQTRNSLLMHKFSKKLLKGTDIFLSQGKSWSKFAIEDMGFDQTRVYTIPNWTATEEHLKIGAERVFSLDDRAQLVFVGWLEEFKGVFELLNAAKSLHDKEYDFKLTFAGRGNAEPKARAYVEENGLQEIVEFVGWIETDLLGALLSRHNIFVLPSWAEGLPNSMIEAMSTGLAVVITRVGMVPDFVVDGEHALLVPAKDESILAEALQRVVADTELREKIAKNGYALASREFAVEPAVGKLADVIDATL